MALESQNDVFLFSFCSHVRLRISCPCVVRHGLLSVLWALRSVIACDRVITRDISVPCVFFPTRPRTTIPWTRELRVRLAQYATANNINRHPLRIGHQTCMHWCLNRCQKLRPPLESFVARYICPIHGVAYLWCHLNGAIVCFSPSTAPTYSFASGYPASSFLTSAIYSEIFQWA